MAIYPYWDIINFYIEQSNMQTEIIKLNSLKASITSLFHNLSNKCKSSKDYDITVIVKQSQTTTSSSTNSECTKLQNVQGVSINQNPLILNEETSEPEISLNDNINTFKSIKSDKSVNDSNLPKMLTKLRFKKKQDKQNCNPTEQLKVKIETSAQTQQKNLLNRSSHTGSCGNSQRFSYKLNNKRVDSQASSNDSQRGDDADGGFLIQNYLNKAVQYIEQAQMHILQEFLYSFKEKYSFINMRTQTKWSLLMAYCKENKLQFERAATNYSQVINNILQNPLMLTIDIADIYCRLGRCYYQIQQWSKAITAYSSSLNIYKKNKKCLEYSNCISNLGVLYLQIGYFTEAERCFLMTFNIKRSQGDSKDKKYRINLLQTYFHLFDCNLKSKNLLQCQQIISNINSIIEQHQAHLNIAHHIRYYIKCGKLLFFQGKFEFSQNYYHHAVNLCKKHNINNQEHAQVLQLLGLLKHQLGDIQKSHCYYQKAYGILQKCVAIQSTKLSTLKRKLEHISEMLVKNRDANKYKLTKNTMIIEDTNHFGNMREKRRNQTAFVNREMIIK